MALIHWVEVLKIGWNFALRKKRSHRIRTISESFVGYGALRTAPYKSTNP